MLRSPLSAFIDFFWLYEGEIPVHKKERRLPDGSVSLIINLRDGPIRIYDQHAPDRFRDCGGVVIGGARSEFALIDTTCQEEILGVQFRPGGAFPFLELPVNELHNEIIPLDILWGEGAVSLREQLRAARTREMRFLALEQFLLAQLADQARSIHPAVAIALKELQNTSYSLELRTMIEQVGVGQTRFIQVFREAVGLTPKQYCRVLRFQEALRVLEGGAQVGWTELALNCGYYDQAHFIHDFQAFAGLTPGAYLARQGGHRNHIALPD
ncbi:MAG: AraC family transcriptional regulator [Ktedonobacteraceae bacterium]|nr:AraC family transcriptional regulator [Ktedonobacteraceae bacterium]